MSKTRKVSVQFYGMPRLAGCERRMRGKVQVVVQPRQGQQSGPAARFLHKCTARGLKVFARAVPYKLMLLRNEQRVETCSRLVWIVHFFYTPTAFGV